MRTEKNKASKYSGVCPTLRYPFTWLVLWNTFACIISVFILYCGPLARLFPSVTKLLYSFFFFFDNFGHKKIYTNAQTRTWIVNFAICILNGVTHCVVSSRFIWYIVIDICEILLEFDVYVCIQMSILFCTGWHISYWNMK